MSHFGRFEVYYLDGYPRFSVGRRGTRWVSGF